MDRGAWQAMVNSVAKSHPWRRGSVVACYRVGALSVAVHEWDFLKEVTFIFITSTIVWPQVR